MKLLPKPNNPLVVRTDFEHHEAWETICNLIRAPVYAFGDTFYAYVEFLEDAAFCGLGTRDLLAGLPSIMSTRFYLSSTLLQPRFQSTQSSSLTSRKSSAAASAPSRQRFSLSKTISQ